MKTRMKALFRSLFFCCAISFIASAEVVAEALPAAEAIASPDTTPGGATLNGKLASLTAQVDKLPKGARRGRFQWVLEHFSRLPESGEKIQELTKLVEESLAALRGGKDVSDAVPWFERGRWQGLRMLDNGNVGLAFVGTGQGVSLESLFDLKAERELLCGSPMPFWSLSLTGADGSAKELNSTQGCDDFRAKELPGETPAEHLIEMEWAMPGPKAPTELRVTCRIRLLGDGTSLWMKVDNASPTWSIRTIAFARVSLGQIGESEDDDFLIVPHGSGSLRSSPIKSKADFSGRYPGGWCSMQLISHYDADCGLYLAAHDPFASTKDFSVKTVDKSRIEALVAWPAPDSGVAGNDWECPGEVVLRTFRGDWFEAAQIYKQWATKDAKWRPQGVELARGDTPPWFEDIAVWSLTGGTPEQVVEPVKKFAEYMGVPTALHWYNWHVIPFDNDYPHYFPCKDGFPEGVKALQKAGVRVMPYINGRLWDTDLDDFKNNAIRFCTKDEKGQPYIEEYGSGAKLSPMCPTTQLWQRTVQDLVLRLVGPEVGVDVVYVDQVAAATPALCFDPTHGHPLAGGHWWNTTGYWPMLTELQKRLSQLYPDKALTTECNAEPYVHVFDGYLTWHFQYQDQIPLFAAVYGGRIQLFSRAYQGDSWKGLAMRMKTGQALVFGEQLGWINPGVISDADSAAFLRRLARLRYSLRDYLARGEMVRPPVLKGDVPTVTADWEWGGKRLVTTPAILSGAWRAQDGRLALIFVNVSDAAQSAELEFDAKRYWVEEPPFVSVCVRTEIGAEEPLREAPRFGRAVRLDPHGAVALEISRGK